MSTYIQIDPTQKLDPFKAVKKLPLEEYFTSGHRTCQGCESALVMKMMAKAVHVRGQHHLLQHFVGASVDAHSTGQQRIGCTGNRRRSESAHAQRKDEERAH